MKTIYTPEHKAHHNHSEFLAGEIRAAFEVPERAEIVLRRIQFLFVVFCKLLQRRRRFGVGTRQDFFLRKEQATFSLFCIVYLTGSTLS
jgi:hypothetical protein